MFERYTEKARRVIFFARYEASQFGAPAIEPEHLLLGLMREDKTLTARFLARAQTSLEAIRKEIEGRAPLREKISTSVELPLAPGDQARARLRARGERPPPAPAHRDGAPSARPPARRALDGRRDSLRARPAPERGARGGLAPVGQRPARGAEEGDAAPRRVLARPDRRRRQRQARPARRPRGRDRARRPDPLPPHEEQPRAHRRARRRQDRHRRRSRAAHRPRRGALVP